MQYWCCPPPVISPGHREEHSRNSELFVSRPYFSVSSVISTPPLGTSLVSSALSSSNRRFIFFFSCSFPLSQLLVTDALLPFAAKLRYAHTHRQSTHARALPHTHTRTQTDIYTCPGKLLLLKTRAKQQCNKLQLESCCGSNLVWWLKTRGELFLNDEALVKEGCS